MIPPEAARINTRLKGLLAGYRKRRDSYARRLLGLRLGEWERFESEELASKCFPTAWNGPGMGLRRFIVFALFIACYLGVNRLILSGFLNIDQQITVFLLSSLVIVLSNSIVAIGSAFLFRRLLRRHLRRAMNNNGMPICLECGYNLTGVLSARCPQCGTSTDCKRLV